MSKREYDEIVAVEQKVDLIYDEVKYLRGKIDQLTWRVITISAGTGTAAAAITAFLTFFGLHQ